MSKKIKFQTKSLGSEPDTREDKEALVSWIRSRGGRGGDIIRYRFQNPLALQREAFIDIPCAGGMFYRERLLECLAGIHNGTITGELGLDPAQIKTDIEEIIKKPDPLWTSMPGPAQLGIADGYYGDPEEASRNLFFWFRRVMREMRDSGAEGTVLICDQASEIELEALCGKKVLIFLLNPARENLEILLEHQRTIIISAASIDLVASMNEEYPVDNLVITDPTGPDLENVLQYWDQDRIQAGGYCHENCQEYWKNVVNSAIFQIPSE